MQKPLSSRLSDKSNTLLRSTICGWKDSISNPPLATILSPFKRLQCLLRYLFRWLQPQGHLTLGCGVSRTDMKRHSRLLLSPNILVLKIQDGFGRQMGQKGVSLGGRADVCGTNVLRWYPGLEVIFSILHASMRECWGWRA